jgi:hypothetical protein
MIEPSLDELCQQYPEQYEYLQEIIYVRPARGLHGYYVMERVSPDEEVILEICPSEQRALEVREHQVWDNLRCFDYRSLYRVPGRWSATSSLSLTFKYAART